MTGSNSNPSSTMIVSTAEEMNPSRRSTMEDCFVFHPPQSWGCPDPNTSFIGVYDGHGGRDIVDFLEEALASTVAQELCQDDDASIHIRLERAFVLTDIASHQMGLDTSGAVVACCLVQSPPDSKEISIHVANTGDARIVLGRTDTRSGPRRIAQRISFDHRADDVNEIDRIQSAGGFVLKGRVVGILAVARALGDHGLKDYVVAKPYTHSVQAQRGDICIVACDGLWDVFSDQEAVDYIDKWSGSKEEVAQGLVKEALRRGSTDNITVVVSFL